MANLTYNSNIFTVDKFSKNGNDYTYKGILVASKLNQKNGQGYKLLDAIDIDWDAAYISSLGSYIYTTEDLIEALNEINRNTEIDDILKDIEELKQRVDNLEYSYVSHEELAYTLLSYQLTLIPGEHIQIDSYNNIISAYDIIGPQELYQILLSYTKVDVFNDFVQEVHSNYYNKWQTYDVANFAAYTYTHSIIDGADSAFDTLAEISDWILSIDGYDVVTDTEYLQQQAYLAINNENHETIYYKTITPGGWVEVEDYAYINPFGYIYDEYTEYIEIWDEETQTYIGSYYNSYVDISYQFEGTQYIGPYYIKTGILKDLEDLYDKIDELRKDVGTKTLAEDYYSYIDGEYCHIVSYSYTGMQLQIENQRNEVENAKRLANTAIKQSEYAIERANIAYNLADTALEQSYYAIEVAEIAYETANEAYDIAYEVSYVVGVPTIEPQFILAYSYTILDILHDFELGNEYQKLYQINNNGQYTEFDISSWYSLIYDNELEQYVYKLLEDNETAILNNEYELYYLLPGQEATGLTLRIEVLEDKVEILEDKVEAFNEILYHLHANNNEARFVKVGFVEDEYTGNIDRTIKLTTVDAEFDTYTGYFYDGIPSAETVQLAITYNIGWDIYRCAYEDIHSTIDDPYRLKTATEKLIELKLANGLT